MGQKKYKILIIDDSPFNREVLQTILSSDRARAAFGKPCTVVAAATGPEGLEKALNEKPDIVLLDIVMSGMTGFDVLAHLKKLDATRAIPVIIISGLDEQESKEKGFSLGASDYITKPYNKTLTLSRIALHLKIMEQTRVIEQLGLIDSVTNIANRRSFDSHLADEWNRSIRNQTPLSIIIVDLDGFKAFNENYGHQQGDVALRAVAEIIGSVLRRATDFAARWGGEEFALLLPDTPAPSAMYMAEQIRERAEEADVPCIGDYEPPRLTVSAGVATMTPTVADSVEDFVGNAASALYTAKGTGRNRVCLYKQYQAPPTDMGDSSTPYSV